MAAKKLEVVTVERAKKLAESVERLRVRNEELAAYLNGGPGNAIDRVANAPDIGLDDATDRARKFWDKLEGRRRSSVPPVR